MDSLEHVGDLPSEGRKRVPDLPSSLTVVLSDYEAVLLHNGEYFDDSVVGMQHPDDVLLNDVFLPAEHPQYRIGVPEIDGFLLQFLPGGDGQIRHGEQQSCFFSQVGEGNGYLLVSFKDNIHIHQPFGLHPVDSGTQRLGVVHDRKKILQNERSGSILQSKEQSDRSALSDGCEEFSVPHSIVWESTERYKGFRKAVLGILRSLKCKDYVTNVIVMN